MQAIQTFRKWRFAALVIPAFFFVALSSAYAEEVSFNELWNASLDGSTGDEDLIFDLALSPFVEFADPGDAASTGSEDPAFVPMRTAFWGNLVWIARFRGSETDRDIARAFANEPDVIYVTGRADPILPGQMTHCYIPDAGPAVEILCDVSFYMLAGWLLTE